MDSATIDALISDFEHSAVSRDRWTHIAHLVIAVVYLRKYASIDVALNALKPMILALNASNGVENTETNGYHHSVTKFMLIAVDMLMGNETLYEDVETVLASELRSGKFPFYFYSHQCLGSIECRKEWVNPDLRDIDMLPSMLAIKAGI